MGCKHVTPIDLFCQKHMDIQVDKNQIWEKEIKCVNQSVGGKLQRSGARVAKYGTYQEMNIQMLRVHVTWFSPLYEFLLSVDNWFDYS